ncbi:MAG: MalY/PatB family protein [Paracoccaceae bacterium]
MNFDYCPNRVGTHSAKWDMMEALYGVSPEDGLSMWVADMDFQSPACVMERLSKIASDGVFGYYNNDAPYKEAIGWWMETRHNWPIRPEWVFTTTGIVNAVGVCLDTYTQPGDGIVLFTPVYHAFAKVINGAHRKVVECEMPVVDGRYTLDFDAWDAQMTGSESMLILCSPHNPGGAVWTQAELQGIADFAERHDLIIVSDEIHQDMVFNGHKHLPFPIAVPSALDRTVVLNAPSKTFNIAGLHNGNVIIPDDDLRARFADRMTALYIGTNTFGTAATEAAYSPAGAEWVDALMVYLDTNRKILDSAVASIPGLSSMRLEATYLSWVDFGGTGMERAEFIRRVEKDAKIAVNYGTTFGKGGENYLRFNIGTQRTRIEEACERLNAAFSDLQ